MQNSGLCKSLGVFSPSRSSNSLTVFIRHLTSMQMSEMHANKETATILNLQNLNPHVLKMEYAVRGPLVIRALALEKELAKGSSKPFKNVIRANIGDAHAMGQKPITFIRQVVACVGDPKSMDTGNYPPDVVERAKALLNECGGHSVGSYSHSSGLNLIRQHVAEYITKRDGGYTSDPDTISLSGGASESIRNVLKLFVNENSRKCVGVMIPIPQYPLYSASIEEFGLGQVGYFLDEQNNWALSMEELERAYSQSADKYDVRVLCVINPGNPTGQVLSRDNIEKIIKFAYKRKLFLMADEVYQDNVYDENAKFHSMKSVMMALGEPYSKMELASFHSVSKGYMGECGLRGGYVELANINPQVFAHYQKMISAKLCSTVIGQVAVDCVVKPPQPGEPSHSLWLKEKTAVLSSLKERAKLVRQAYASVKGIRCNPVQGAMYAFPQIIMPNKAIEKAKQLNQSPDFFYAMQLLESSGVCVVPGSGFGQKEGTYHFRTTILPSPEVMQDMLQRFRDFHEKFLKLYS